MPRPSRTALILYGSETGNAQDVAEEVGRLTERLRFVTTVLDLDSVAFRDLVKYTVVIFAISTTGQGDFPQNARRFWKTLLSSALKPGLLKKLRFATFGLGDSSYARFNTAHRMLHGRLLQLGARSFCERGEGNEQHPEGHSAGFREWIVLLKAKLLESFPLPAELPPIADDVFLEPKWKLEAHAPLQGVAQSNSDGHADGRFSNGESNDGSEKIPASTLLPVKGAYIAQLVQNARITASDHFQDVRHMDLRIDQAYDYGPGAVAVIYPKNFPDDVNTFVELMGWHDIVDSPMRLVDASESAVGASSTPSPLRHLDLQGTTLTLRWLLENVLDIMSIPRRSFFADLAHFAKTETEDEKYQKDRLLELANPELIDELWDYTTRPKRTIVEVMMDFTTIKVPWQYALTAIPLMKGRQFSIASGGDLKQDVKGRTKVELLVAIADPPSPIIKYRRRYGVCTRYITSLKQGQRLSVGLQQGYLHVKPSEMDVPVVMIGPGTGLAPMRAMVHQRLAWAQDHGVRQIGQRLRGDILVFGCRSEEADFFFRDEWERFSKEEGLTLLAAFSRGKGPRQYVQDRIRAQGAMIYEALVVKNGKVYICGSSGNMPKGVREALLDVLVEGGKDLERSRAEEYLDHMEKQGRYKQETW
jgi:sulfite reductase alpha subunit-like flavoprotein